jgi:hypothetical protein
MHPLDVLKNPKKTDEEEHGHEEEGVHEDDHAHEEESAVK